MPIERERARLQRAFADMAAGRPIVVADSEAQPSQGVLAVAASEIDADAINFMVRFARGIVCLALTAERARELELPRMVPGGEDVCGRSAFTVSIEARTGVTTGISAADRARTIRVAVDPASGPHDLSRPGHVFPIVAHPAGVLGRAGLPEAALDAARMAVRGPAAAFCHVMSEDGSVAELDELLAFAERHDLALVTVDELVRARLEAGGLIELDVRQELPTPYGRFRIVSARTVLPGAAPLSLVLGEIDADVPVPVYLYRACDAAGSFEAEGCCGCNDRMHDALRWIQDQGHGVLVHEASAGGGAVDADEPCLGAHAPREGLVDALAPALLRRLGVRRVRLLEHTGASELERLTAWGFQVVEVVTLDGAVPGGHQEPAH